MVELLVSHQPGVCSAVGTNLNSIVPLLNASRANSFRLLLCLVCDDLLDDHETNVTSNACASIHFACMNCIYIAF